VLPGSRYVIDFKVGQNFEGQVEPLELAAGRAHPILSLTLADGRQVSLAQRIPITRLLAALQDIAFSSKP